MNDKELPSFDAVELDDVYDSPEGALFSASAVDFESALQSTDTINLDVVVGELDSGEGRRAAAIASTGFGEFLHALPVPTLLIDRQHTIIFVNRSWKKITSDYEQLYSRPFSSLFSQPSIAKKAEALLDQVFEAKKARVSGAVLEIEGNRIWSRLHLRSIHIGADKWLIVLVEDTTPEKRQLLLTRRHREELLKARDELEDRVRDRTIELSKLNDQLMEEVEQRRRAEEHLKVSRAGFTSIVEKTEEGIAVVDPNGIVLYANPAAATFLGRSKDTLVGARLGRTLSAGEIKEIKGSRSSGEPGILEMRVEPTDWNGNPAFLAMFRDITERKNAEQEILKAHKLQSVERIAGGIAHDFNNFLTGTLANISLAKMLVTPDSPAHEALKNAEKSAEVAKDLTQQLLTFTRGEVEPAGRFTSLSGILKQTALLCLSGSHVKCEMTLPDGLWAARADPQQISQVVQNLLINAQESMPEGGTITLSAENWISSDTQNSRPPESGEARYVKICVKDNGPGIAEADLSKIFDPYFTTKSRGTGLGLSIAYSIVKKHSGKIDVESEPNAGTTFHIYLPAYDEKAESSVVDSVEIPEHGQGRILLMDDEEAIRTATGDLLRLLGYEVDCAKDGAEAIAMYEAALDSVNPFSVVIMDLTIPGGMGGKTAIKELLKIDPHVTAIVSSGYSTDPVMSDYKHYGFKGIVPKPYNAQDLARTLHDVLSCDAD